MKVFSVMPGCKIMIHRNCSYTATTLTERINFEDRDLVENTKDMMHFKYGEYEYFVKSKDVSVL